MDDITASHVIDPAKRITSRSAVRRAVKARRTLATAVAIMRASSEDPIQNEVAAMQIERRIRELNATICRYYADAAITKDIEDRGL